MKREPEVEAAMRYVAETDFWRSSSELRSAEIGRWLIVNKLAPWPKGHPPSSI